MQWIRTAEPEIIKQVWIQAVEQKDLFWNNVHKFSPKPKLNIFGAMFFGAWGRDAPSAKGDPSCEGGIGTAGDVGRRPEGHMAMILIGFVGFCWLWSAVHYKNLSWTCFFACKKVAIAPSGHGMPREDPHWLSLRTLAESQNEDPDGHMVMVMTTWLNLQTKVHCFRLSMDPTDENSQRNSSIRKKSQLSMLSKSLVIWESWFLIIAVIAVIAKNCFVASPTSLNNRFWRLPRKFCGWCAPSINENVLDQRINLLRHHPKLWDSWQTQLEGESSHLHCSPTTILQHPRHLHHLHQPRPSQSPCPKPGAIRWPNPQVKKTNLL